MVFPPAVIGAAWLRQKGRCAKCGKKLVRVNQDRGIEGCWHAHHRLPTHIEGNESVQNCVILCTDPPDCHFTIGHGGVSDGYYATLSDDELPFLNCP
jgi:hypothetical protein